jgi:hypothetical protein
MAVFPVVPIGSPGREQNDLPTTMRERRYQRSIREEQTYDDDDPHWIASIAEECTPVAMR